MINEHCWVLLGDIKNGLWWGKRVKETEGEPCRVAFDYNWVIKQEEKYGNVLGFWHTHPGMTAHYSCTDHRTMGAWINCLGKKLVCCIKGVDGLRAWWYFNDEDLPIEYPAKALKGIIFGTIPEESKMTRFAQVKNELFRTQEPEEKYQQFIADYFDDIIYTRTKDGQEILCNTEGNEITLFADTDLVKVRFIEREIKVYYTVGICTYTGNYEVVPEMKLCRSYKDKFGIERKPWENYSNFDEFELVRYLVQFVK